METIDSLRSCSDVSKRSDESEIIPFLGWEWTQTSLNPKNHWWSQECNFEIPR